MFGREPLDREQVSSLVVQALRETVMEPDLSIDEGENLSLERDLDIDDIVMADLVENLEREFEIQVSSEDAEEWSTFQDVVLGMLAINNRYAEQSGLEDYEEDD